jgi:uncharacterized membrane protein HdeD (DUF308 family)
MLAAILSRFWWMTLLRGIIWVAFGLMAFVRPGLMLPTLTTLFGILAFADGVGNVLHAVNRGQEKWWALLLAGFAGIGVGVITLASPGITELVLLFYIAVWAIATGLLEIVAALRLRQDLHGEGWLALAGILSVAFGALLFARRGLGALAVMWLIAAYAMSFGVILIALALRERDFHRPRPA